MDKGIKALDLYYEAVKKGVADVNSQLEDHARKTIENYENQIEDITSKVNESNLKIRDMLTAKTTASKEYKKTLTTMIAQERETIAQYNLEIKEAKKQISLIKEETKELVESSVLIEDGLSSSLSMLKAEDKNLVQKYNLWYESEGEDGHPSADIVKRQELVSERLEIQAEKILEVESAYKKMVEIYGEAAEESINLENQLLSECIAYEKLKDAAFNLAEDTIYSREDVDKIAHDMNDYIKNNYTVLKEAGFSDEVIYQAARGVSGYDEFLKSGNVAPGSEATAAQKQADEIIDNLNVKFSGVSAEFAKNVEGTVTGLISSVSGVISDIVAKTADTIKNAGNNIYNNSYTSNYTLTQAGSETISDSINTIKNFEALKKARGI